MDMGKTLVVTTIVCMLLAISFDAQAGGRGHHNGGHYYGHGHGHGYRYGYGHSGHGAGYLIGGLVLGSMLTHAYERRHQPYIVHESSVVQIPAETQRRVSRRLFRDRNGNCFERNFNSAGDELLVELDPSECAW
jgi:hypothetical protein